MTTPSNLDRDKIRQFVSKTENVTWLKSDINAAIDALNTLFESSRAAISTAIDDASAVNFTVEQKRKIVKAWLKWKFGDE